MWRVRAEELESEKANVEETANEASARLSIAAADAGMWRTRAEELESERLSLEQSGSEASAQLQIAVADAGMWRTRAEELESERLSLEQSGSEASAQLQIAVADAAMWRTKAEEVIETPAAPAATAATMLMSSAPAEAAAAARDLDGLTLKYDALRSELNKVNEDRARLGHELAEARSAHKADVNEVHVLVPALKAELDATRKQMAVLQADLDDDDEERDALMAQIGKLRAQLDARSAPAGVAFGAAPAAVALVAPSAPVVVAPLAASEAAALVAPAAAAAKAPQAEVEAAALVAPSAPAVAATVAAGTVAALVAPAAAAAAAERVTAYTLSCPQHLSDIKGIGSVWEGRLYAAGIGTYWELANTPRVGLISTLGLTSLQLERFDYDGIVADALRLADETGSRGREWDSHQPDDFEPLQGLGFTYEKRLYDAGICTYAALAAATDEQLDKICQPPKSRRPDYESWRVQARTRSAGSGATGAAAPAALVATGGAKTYKMSCPQHLSDVKGIGSVWEGRLYAAGIGTYWELANTAKDTLISTLALTGLQKERFNYEAIVADALRLAGESGSMGREWDAHQPDDFEPIEGLGFTYEKRLYDAGICTYAALVEASDDKLNEISRPPKFRKPDYASWRAQAGALMAKK
jgi:predicted flap endonuclease-1-like 5' DNA nuclease